MHCEFDMLWREQEKAGRRSSCALHEILASFSAIIASVLPPFGDTYAWAVWHARTAPGALPDLVARRTLAGDRGDGVVAAGADSLSPARQTAGHDRRHCNAPNG
jgi:hypothetical protein